MKWGEAASTKRKTLLNRKLTVYFIIGILRTDLWSQGTDIKTWFAKIGLRYNPATSKGSVKPIDNNLCDFETCFEMLSFYLLVTWKITYLAGNRTRKQFYLCVDSGIKRFNYQYKIISFFYQGHPTRI